MRDVQSGHTSKGQKKTYRYRIELPKRLGQHRERNDGSHIGQDLCRQSARLPNVILILHSVHILVHVLNMYCIYFGRHLYVCSLSLSLYVAYHFCNGASNRFLYRLLNQIAYAASLVVRSSKERLESDAKLTQSSASGHVIDGFKAVQNWPSPAAKWNAFPSGESSSSFTFAVLFVTGDFPASWSVTIIKSNLMRCV